MAASIGEPVVFADDIKDPSVLNVANCGTEESVIVTQNPNLINLYKVRWKLQRLVTDLTISILSRNSSKIVK